MDPASSEHCFLVACCPYDSGYAALSQLPVYLHMFAAEIRLLHATQYVVVTVDCGLALGGIRGKVQSKHRSFITIVGCC